MKDLIFCLTLMQNAINPPLARQSFVPTTSSNLASTLMRGSNTHGKTHSRFLITLINWQVIIRNLQFQILAIIVNSY